jgi:hypothetical protein
MQPKFLYIFFIAVIYTFAIPADLSAQEWKFIKERDGIKVYTRNEENNPVKSYKGEVDMKTDMTRLRKVIGSIDSFDWWDENIKEIKVLDYQKEKLIKYYLVYDVPWPLEDRDLCVEAHITNDSVTGKRMVMATPLLNVIPENPDKVRIKNYWQSWTMEPAENGIVHIKLEGSVDPGGSIPAWIINMVITDTPLNIIKKVRDIVEVK